MTPLRLVAVSPSFDLGMGHKTLRLGSLLRKTHASLGDI